MKNNGTLAKQLAEKELAKRTTPQKSLIPQEAETLITKEDGEEITWSRAKPKDLSFTVNGKLAKVTVEEKVVTIEEDIQSIEVGEPGEILATDTVTLAPGWRQIMIEEEANTEVKEGESLLESFKKMFIKKDKDVDTNKKSK